MISLWSVSGQWADTLVEEIQPYLDGPISLGSDWSVEDLKTPTVKERNSLKNLRSRRTSQQGTALLDDSYLAYKTYAPARQAGQGATVFVHSFRSH